MKKIIITFFALGITLLSFAQENFDARLLEKYTEAEITQIQKDNPDDYAILVRALDVGLVVADYVEKDGKKIEFDGILDADPNEKHTFASLGIDLKENRNQYFKFKGTNKIAIVYSKNTIMKIK